MKNWYPYSLIFIVSEQQHKYLCIAPLDPQTINEVTANNRFSGNDLFSGTKAPDRFLHYNGRWLYLLAASWA